MSGFERKLTAYRVPPELRVDTSVWSTSTHNTTGDPPNTPIGQQRVEQLPHHSWARMTCRACARAVQGHADLLGPRPSYAHKAGALNQSRALFGQLALEGLRGLVQFRADILTIRQRGTPIGADDKISNKLDDRS